MPYHFFLKGELSQWWKSPFVENNIQFLNCEQYMMFHKANLFNDLQIASEILSTNNPKIAKDLGRQVKNFNQTLWDKNKYNIVYNGNYLKFKNNKKLLTLLLETSPKLLVETNPRDLIWSNGLSEEQSKITPEKMWPGQNLLGKILTQIRNDLSHN
jgi:hypothetical protein